MKKLIAIVLSIGLLTSTCFGQIPEEKLAAPPSPRQQLATIIFAGLAGAVLGLSTLSFYGRPQDKLSNIAVGFAIGVIGGAVFTTFKAATGPHSSAYPEDVQWNHRPMDWQEPQDNPVGLGYNWSF